MLIYQVTIMNQQGRSLFLRGGIYPVVIVNQQERDLFLKDYNESPWLC